MEVSPLILTIVTSLLLFFAFDFRCELEAEVVSREWRPESCSEDVSVGHFFSMGKTYLSRKSSTSSFPKSCLQFGDRDKVLLGSLFIFGSSFILEIMIIISSKTRNIDMFYLSLLCMTGVPREFLHDVRTGLFFVFLSFFSTDLDISLCKS